MVLSGRRAELQPLTPNAYDFVYSMVADPEVSVRWRYRGAVPSREHVIAQLWDSVLIQHLVVDRSTKNMAGLVNLYNFNSRSNNCYAAAVAHPAFRQSGVVLEGLLLLIEHGFDTWAFNKVYFEVLDFNLSQFGGLQDAGVEEARLKNYDFAYGRYWDSVTWSISRERWAEISESLLRRHPGPERFGRPEP